MNKKTENSLRARWHLFCQRNGSRSVSHADELFSLLKKQYRTPKRFYHTLGGHIASCLEEFETVRHRAKNPVALEAAIWMHDACYDSRRHNNEGKSARFMREVLAYFVQSPGILNEIEKLILFTQHQRPPKTPDEKMLSDIDLSIFGKACSVFNRYERNIRKEYIWIPLVEYRRRRANLLKKFLMREQLYYLDMFQEMYENRARKNLTRSIKKLESR